jgi:hypothetical protein
VSELTIDNAEYLSELLVTDTRIYEVLRRTEDTIRVRQMRSTENVVRRDNIDGNPYPVVYRECVSDTGYPIRLLRRRKDGTFRFDRSGHALRPVAEPVDRTDYRE